MPILDILNKVLVIMSKNTSVTLGNHFEKQCTRKISAPISNCMF